VPGVLGMPDGCEIPGVVGVTGVSIIGAEVGMSNVFGKTGKVGVISGKSGVKSGVFGTTPKFGDVLVPKVIVLVP